MQKLIIFLYTTNKQSEKEIKKTIEAQIYNEEKTISSANGVGKAGELHVKE